MIIGVCGLIGGGKGTVGDILVEHHGFQKISFADKLKDAVALMFDWDRSLVEGITDESRQWREKKDEFWSKETGREITPRLVLQEFGTECMRKGFFDGIWVSMVKNEILKNPNQNYVVPDVRFPNEGIIISSIVLSPPLAWPAVNILVLFDAPAHLYTPRVVSPKSIVFDIDAIVKN